MLQFLHDMAKTPAHFGQIYQPITSILQLHDAKYLKDGISKNAFLDAVMLLLHSYKTVEVAPAEAAPETPAV